jgi:hypothetical protein
MLDDFDVMKFDSTHQNLNEFSAAPTKLTPQSATVKFKKQRIAFLH